MITKFAVLAVSSFFVGVSVANAHEFWLKPHGDNKAGERISFSAHVGADFVGEQIKRIPGQVQSFVVYEGVNAVSKALSGRDGTSVFGHFLSSAADPKTFILVSNKFDIEVNADEFNLYLEDEGLDQALALRTRLGLLNTSARESFYRVAKSIVGGASRADKVFDLPLEISLLDVPNTNRAPKTTVLVTANGMALANQQVKARPISPDGPLQVQRTDAQGIAVFTTEQSALWAFGTTSVSFGGGPEARWQSVWSSLTIEIGDDK